ncbi:MAG: alpha-galactosidase, partial [Caldilineaceae bacterium]
ESISAPATWPSSFQLDGSAPQYREPIGELQLTAALHADRVTETRLQQTADGLTCTLEMTSYQHFPAVDWMIRFANHGQHDTPILSDILPLDLLFPLDPGQPCQVHHARGGLTQTDDFEPLTTPLTFRQGGSPLRLSARTGKSSTLHLPFFNLEMGTGGVIGAIGWSGGWSAGFERTRAGVRVVAGMERTHLRLHPGEEIRTPRIVLLFWEGDRDEAHNTWRRFILEHYTPRPTGELLRPPFCDGVWGARTAQSHVEKIHWLHDERIPTECYWIDAGWYGERPLAEAADGLTSVWMIQAGSWSPNGEGYPEGLAPVGDAAAAAGLGFVLWVEPERVHDGTRIAHDHPDWLLGPTPCSAGGDNYLLNLGNPAARQHITDLVSGLIVEGRVTVLRQDFNDLRVPQIWAQTDAPDRVGMAEIAHITGLYAFWDDLLARHPGLVIDNCAGGGQRIDIETIARTVPLWRSDLQCFPYNPMAMQTQTQGLAPWVPLSAASCDSATVYGMRSAFGPSIVTHWSSMALEGGMELPLDLIRRHMNEALAVRKYFYGDFYPLLTFSLAADAWAAWQYHRPDLREGIVLVFRRHASPFAEATLKLRALDPSATYEVTNADTDEAQAVAGKQLLQEGLRVLLPERPQSALFVYQRL